MKHLELFSGIGGFRRALELVGKDLNIPMKSVGYSEIDANALKTYRACFNPNQDEIALGDIVAFTSEKDKIERLPDFDILTGGFPCQPFSMMGKLAGFNEMRGQMFFRIVDVLAIKRPRYVLLENVKNLLKHDSGRTFGVIKTELENLGYQVSYDVFDTSDFLLPQKRNRLVVFAIRNGNKLPEKDLFRSAEIQKLFLANYKNLSVSHYKNVCSILSRDVDAKYFLSDRIKPTLLSDGSAGFKSKSDINQIIARPLTATMHKMHRACQDNYYSQDFIDSKGKVNPVLSKTKEELAKIPIRKITPREAFLLQGFPSEFVIKAKKRGVPDGALYKQAGNAVSVNTIYAILYFLFVNKILEA